MNTIIKKKFNIYVNDLLEVILNNTYLTIFPDKIHNTYVVTWYLRHDIGEMRHFT